MPTSIRRSDVQRLAEAGGQVVEVLPRDEYDEEHLAGAIQVFNAAGSTDVVIDVSGWYS